MSLVGGFPTTRWCTMRATRLPPPPPQLPPPPPAAAAMRRTPTSMAGSSATPRCRPRLQHGPVLQPRVCQRRRRPGPLPLRGCRRAPGPQGLGGPRPVKRRGTANRKERRRTQSINSAFAELRECIPNVPADTKLSKIKTLRLATSYIAYLMDLLAKDDQNGEAEAFKAEIKKTDVKEEKRKKELHLGRTSKTLGLDLSRSHWSGRTPHPVSVRPFFRPPIGSCFQMFPE
uniref:Heart- and neural crest derivatives-expressed protein 2 n=1 Tax=Macaca fascicularis TaxID=9541 RepID=A0A2K5WR18_MACFA